MEMLFESSFVISHSATFSRHGDGGHYHFDTTPDEVEYIGYFNLAEGELCRVIFT